MTLPTRRWLVCPYLLLAVFAAGCLSDPPRADAPSDEMSKRRQPLAAGPVVAKKRQKLTFSRPDREDRIGTGVAIDGDRAAVGAPEWHWGAVQMYQRRSGKWIQSQRLEASDGNPYDYFGTDVALDGKTLVVGAPRAEGNEKNAGAVYVYRRANRTWTEQAKLTASDGREDARFGASVALSGDTIAVGAPRVDRQGTRNAGAIYVFERSTGSSGSRWTEKHQLTLRRPGQDANLGADVALGARSLLAGLPGRDSPKLDAGAAVIFTKKSGGWSSYQRLNAPNPKDYGHFGQSVALDGDSALIGSPGEDHGSLDSAGAAYLFERQNGTWRHTSRLTGSPPALRAAFGAGTAIQGDTALIAAETPFPSKSRDNGAVEIFRRVSGSWSSTDRFEASGSATRALSDDFGKALALEGDTILVGAPGTWRRHEDSAGASFIYRMLPDGDGDGSADADDACPTDPNKQAPGTCGCGTRDTDTDGDGRLDCNDGCPSDANKTSPGRCGCGFRDSDDDTDGDGTSDCRDRCYADPHKTEPGICGCQHADTDTDGDGTADCNDECPEEAAKIRPGTCGCGVGDTDGDGTDDCEDDCPEDPRKTEPGACGCGTPETDTDGDGTPDCEDRCPSHADKIQPGACGCATPDTDIDGDETPDCEDQCPMDPGGSHALDCDTDRDGILDTKDNCPETKNFEQIDTDGDGKGDACDEVDDRAGTCADCAGNRVDVGAPDTGVDGDNQADGMAPDGCAQTGHHRPIPPLAVLLVGLFALVRFRAYDER